MQHEFINLQRLTSRLETRVDSLESIDHHEYLKLQAVRFSRHEFNLTHSVYYADTKARCGATSEGTGNITKS